jgi:hypothetical protein
MTRLNRTVRRAVERRLDKAGPKKPPLRTRVLQALGIVVGVPGVLAASLALLPRVNVTVSDPVDPDDPFSAAATITNTGYIPLDAVWPAIGIGQISTVPNDKPVSNVKWDYLPCYRRSQWKPRYLALDDKFTFALNDVWQLETKGSLSYADIAVAVDYEIPVLHWHRRKLFPIVAHRQTNGRLYWYPKPFE